MRKIIFFFIVFLTCVSSTNVQSQTSGDNELTGSQDFLSSGKFVIGANYWASHAGPAMWSDWRPDIVEQDFSKLADAGIKLLRVFPTWPDFQPLNLLLAGGGVPKEYRFGENPLPDDEAGKAGVSKEAIGHFEEFILLAEKYDIKLIVGILTGHMSGRNYVPNPFKLMNPITDPEAIKWEIRFINFFVSKFKDESAIVGWDLGNECNHLWNKDLSSEEAWCWTSHITKTIKAIDPTRPVISGISAYDPAIEPWNMQDVGELTDNLTVHFYHTFKPASELEPLNTIRPILSPIAMNIETESIGGKPSFIEEFGTLGPLFGDDGSEGVKPGFLRSNLFSLWTHNCRGLLWWIAFDQGYLEKSPFDWNSRGSEYGLWYQDGNPKPVLKEIQKFTEFLSDFEYPALPERIVDGVCILTEGQDNWKVANSSFVLAKQAGLDIVYQYCNQPIKDAEIFFMPSVFGPDVIDQHRMRVILQKVKDGATLYISNDDGHIGPNFSEITGIKVKSYTRKPHEDKIIIDGVKEDLEIKASVKHILQVETAKVLAVDQDGNPAFTCNEYGKGKVFYLNYPLEKFLADKPGAFDGKKKNKYWGIYNLLKESVVSSKVVSISNDKIGFTEHIVNDSTRIAVLVNYFPEIGKTNLKIRDGWEIYETLYGKHPSKNNIEIGSNDAMILKLKKL